MSAKETDPLLESTSNSGMPRRKFASLRQLDERPKPSSSLSTRSFRINSSTGKVNYRTPVQLAREELHRNIPMNAIFGLGKLEKSIVEAFTSFAADLDLEQAVSNKKCDECKTQQEMRRVQSIAYLKDELDIEKSVVTAPLVFAVLVASLAQFLVGYNTGVMNAPTDVVFPGHSTAQWSLAVAAFAIGGPFGSMIAGTLADTRGRKGALLIDSVIFFIGGLIQSIATNMNHIIISRFIIGFASGYSSVLVPIYLGEMSPPTLRGTLGTMTQFALVIGILASDFLAFPLAKTLYWRYLFGVTPMIAILQILLAPVLLESPRWLISQESPVAADEARVIIRKLRGYRYGHDIEEELENIANILSSNDKDDKHRASWSALLKNKDTRMKLCSAILLQMGQQLSGINAVFYYSSSFFKGVIDNPLVGTTLVGLVNVLATYVALLVMDSYKRRTLLIWSTTGMLASCILTVLALLNYVAKPVALFAVISYVSFFEIGLGPIPWLIVAEMFDANFVSSAMSLSSQINWACNFIVGFVFPYLVEYFGPFSFLPFASVLLFTLFFIVFYLEEPGSSDARKTEMVTRLSTSSFHNFDVHENYLSSSDLQWLLQSSPGNENNAPTQDDLNFLAQDDMEGNYVI